MVGHTGGVENRALEKVRTRFREELPYWAEHVGRIVDKRGKRIPFELNPGQAELDRALEGQRAEGKPMRAIILKARQVGFSTYAQAKLVHRATQRERWNSVTVAHDKNTGRKLYSMAETFYSHLPNKSDREWAGLELKPGISAHRRGHFMRFGTEGREAWASGESWPDSEYLLDTAGEFQAGRGGTFQGMHLSEVAFWANITFKLTALLQGVPDDPESLVIIESTPNGHNAFKDLWDRAVNGESEFIPFFWPWWKHAEYQSSFMNAAERDAFVVGDGPYGEEEEELVALHDVTLEQLFWRRSTIANKCGGDVKVFHQEYPSNPDEAFLASGHKVFDPYRVRTLFRHVDQTDPRVTAPDSPGPVWGEFRPGSHRAEAGRTGMIEVPEQPQWVPRLDGPKKQPWRLWLPPEALEGGPKGSYIVSVDPAGGELVEGDKPDFHAIQVIDHKTREQVGEFADRQMDPELVAVQALLAALWFDNAWIAVERNGGFGMPIIRKIKLDFRYPYLFRAKRFGSKSEKNEAKFGWHTSPSTKPMLVSGMQALLRADSPVENAGVNSRVLVEEMNTYIRDEKGRTNASKGANDDRLMAYMIAQQVASEIPLVERTGPIHARSSGFSGAFSTYSPHF